VRTSAPVALDSEVRNAPPASAGMDSASMRTATQHILAVADAFQFAEPAAEADVDKALDEVLSGLRAVKGLEGGLAGSASRGVASAKFIRLVEGVVKAKLRAEVEATEARGLIRAKLVGEVAPQDEFDRFALNAAAAVDTALGLVYEALRQGGRGQS